MIQQQQQSDQIATNTSAISTLNAASFTKFFASSAQAITSAGLLTLAHGMGAVPTLVQTTLICGVSDGGYTPGDQVFVNVAANRIQTGPSQGLSIVPDATNLNIRFGSTASVLELIAKNTGNSFDIVNSRWTIVFRAWA